MYASVGLLLETLFAFWVVALHELAHIIVAAGMGFKVVKLELLPFGGVVQFDEPFFRTRRAEIIIALAGPVHNFIFAGLSFYLLHKGIIPVSFGKFIFEINLAMGLFNLLPAIPLDGGRVFRAILSESIGIVRATEIAVNLGRILGLVILVSGVFFVITGKGNILLPSLGGFLIFAATREPEKALYLHMRDSLRKKERLIDRGLSHANIIISYKETAMVKIARKFRPGKISIVAVVDDKLDIIGFITETSVLEGMSRYGPGSPVYRVVM
jgi:stage IV sporulation protein FB